MTSRSFQLGRFFVVSVFQVHFHRIFVLAGKNLDHVENHRKFSSDDESALKKKIIKIKIRSLVFVLTAFGKLL